MVATPAMMQEDMICCTDGLFLPQDPCLLALFFPLRLDWVASCRSSSLSQSRSTMTRLSSLVLKDKPKWIERRMRTTTANRECKKQKTSVDASPSLSALPLVAGNGKGGQPSESAQERPARKKKEKQRLRQCSTMEAMEFLVAKRKEADVEKDLKKEERCRKAFALQEERIRIEKEKVEFKRQLEEERLMNIDMTTLNYKQQQYYERRREEILAKLLNN